MVRGRWGKMREGGLGRRAVLVDRSNGMIFFFFSCSCC